MGFTRLLQPIPARGLSRLAKHQGLSDGIERVPTTKTLNRSHFGAPMELCCYLLCVVFKGTNNNNSNKWFGIIAWRMCVLYLCEQITWQS